MDSIEQRLNKLERENRRLKVGGLLLAASLLAAIAFAYVQAPVAEAQTFSERIVARQISIVNNQGETVAMLYAGDDGRPFLSLSAPSSPESRSEPQFVVTTIADKDGGGSLMAFGSPDDGAGIVLRTTEDGRLPFIGLFNRRGQVIWSAP